MLDDRRFIGQLKHIGTWNETGVLEGKGDGCTTYTGG